MSPKLKKQILKEINKKWNGEFQIGYSELALQDTIDLTEKAILEKINKLIKFHEKHFIRYSKEVIKHKDDKSQVEYSETKAIEEMNIIENLKKLIREISL